MVQSETQKQRGVGSFEIILLSLFTEKNQALRAELTASKLLQGVHYSTFIKKNNKHCALKDSMSTLNIWIRLKQSRFGYASLAPPPLSFQQTPKTHLSALRVRKLINRFQRWI